VSFFAYAAGMGLAVGAAALAVALSRGALLGRLRRWGPAFVRAGGVLLVATGGYVAYYGWWEIRVLRGETVDSPVIAAGEALQRSLASAISSLGPAGIAVIVALLGATPFVVRALRRRRDGQPSR
jgi:cytochrome c-type biogenesis protein